MSQENNYHPRKVEAAEQGGMVVSRLARDEDRRQLIGR